MVDLMPPLPEPQIINHFPNCVALKMHFELEETPAAAASDPFAASALDIGHGNGNGNGQTNAFPKVVISLTIQLSGEQEFDVPGRRFIVANGNATFGIRRCELKCELVGCKLPLEEVALKDTFKVAVTVEAQREQSSESQAGLGLGGTVGEKPGGTATGTLGYKQARKATEKMTFETFQVHKSGSEEHPMWVFEVKTGHPILTGTLTKEKLGTLSLLKENPLPGASVRAVLSTRPGDIHITWGQVGWTQDITRNKLALIELAIAKQEINRRLEPLLSTSVWEWKYA
jgi:hypothetical protein